MSDQLSSDVVVVGAGLAGLTAANRVAEAGLSVRVLEKSTDEAYLCNSRYTGGLFHIAMDDMLGKSEWVMANIRRATSGEADPELAETLVTNAPQAIAWLKQQGIRFIKAGPTGLYQNALSPPGVRQTGLNWKGRCGDVMLRTLGERLAQRRGILMRGVRALRILTENGRCVGLDADSRSRPVQLWARAVVLADGGFQANPDLIRR